MNVSSCSGIAASTAQRSAPTRPVIVASKPFGESYLLAEMFAQLLEARGLRVDRRPGLGATEIAFRALRGGAIDVYPEYTGTGLLAILGETPLADARAVYQRVVEEFRQRFGVRWLAAARISRTRMRSRCGARPPTRCISRRSAISRALGGSLRAGLTPDFIGRADGLARTAARVWSALPRRASRCGRR